MHIRVTSLKLKIGFLGLVLSMASHRLEAGQVMVSRGQLDMSAHHGAIAVSGDRAFMFLASVDPLAGVFDPRLCDGGMACEPGAMLSLRAAWSGNDLAGLVTLDGRDYPSNSASARTGLAVEFAGAVQLPDLQSSAELRTRFTFAGTFTHPNPVDATAPAVVEGLTGSGNAVVTLQPAQTPGRWRVTRVLYDFGFALPTSWASRDLGLVEPVGSAIDNQAVFVVSGSGADIWGNVDQFRFTYMSLDGDGSVTARVTSQSGQHPFAKAGVMLRHSVAPSSPHVILDLKPGGGLEFMTRMQTGQPTQFIAGGNALAPAVWLRLTRQDDTVSGYQSADGRSWQLVGQVVVAMPLTPLAGLAVTSHDAARLNRVTFDHVAVRADSPGSNLLNDGDFERFVPPRLGPPGWQSDALRQIPATSETHQPRTGLKNGACWTPAFLDCGLYQEVTAPATGSYRLRVHASADRPGGLVGANVNGELAATANVDARPFGGYVTYRETFTATAGDTIRVWMYSPARPGYVVIDDVTLATLDVQPTIVSGSWVVSALPPPLARFDVMGTNVSFSGRWLESGSVPALAVCAFGGSCAGGTVIDLSSAFENQNPGTPPVTAAPGSATVRGRDYPFIEYAGAQYLTSALIELPPPPSGDHPQPRSVTAPFVATGTLKGYEVLGMRDPRLAFAQPFIGRGTATVDLISGPGVDGPRWTVWRIRYEFASESSMAPAASAGPPIPVTLSGAGYTPHLMPVAW